MGKRSAIYPSDQIHNTKTRQGRFEPGESGRQARLRRVRQQLKDERMLWRYEAVDDLEALSTREVALLARRSARQ